MENASKALLIAGGVLIALIIIAMFIMMLNKMSNLKNAQQEQIEIEQLAAFNAEFEAYNKKAMYGTDVITLMNKAIQNNLNVNANSLGDRRYINIKFKLKDSVQTTIIKEDMTTGEKKDSTDYDFIQRNFGYNLSRKTIEKDKWYSLGIYDENELKMDENIKKLFSSETKDLICQKENYRYHIKSALNNFMMTVFKCTSTKYDEDGRIMELTIEQK